MRRSLLLPLLAALVLANPVHAETKLNTDKLNKKVENFTLPDAAGKDVSLHGLKDKKAVVVVFLSFECPVSNSYAAILGEMARNYEKKGVAFVGVVSDLDLDAATLTKHVKESRLPFPVLRDNKFVAADICKAGYAPETFV